MVATDLSLFASLRDAYGASRAVRTHEELLVALEHVAALISDRLGWGAVAITLHRRAWDDFETAVVHGSEQRRAELLGGTRSWKQWASLLSRSHEHRGAHLVPAQVLEVAVPIIIRADGELGTMRDAWHPCDMLLVLMRDADGEVTGILSVDEPASGCRPSDRELDALVNVAAVAGAAVEQAREASAQTQRQCALQELLEISTRMADARSDTEVLDTVCAGIRDALGFERVAVQLVVDGGEVCPAASVGWDAVPQLPVPIWEFRRVLRAEYEEQGCYVLDHVTALRILGLPDSPYVSVRNGRGPWAWNRHWLVVPLREPDGGLAGFIWVDEPRDRLLPDTQRLQALRLFADQAQSALEAARHYEETLHLAQHDGLTGLPNRWVLLERLRDALRRTAHDDQAVAVLFVDIDRFKTINDTHGHEAGDEVLRAIAARLEDDLRPGDTVARVGGDEFVLVCKDVAGQADAVEIARRIRAHIAQPITVGSTVINLTASVGISLPRESADDATSLLRFADVAMYRAKSAGRDAEEVASADIRAGARARTRLEQALTGALERGEMHLHWQPIVAVDSGRILRAEALMRWEHPTLGPVAPLEFIPLAEENGSIVTLGCWALEEACAQWAAWRDVAGGEAPAVAVNLSPRQLREPLLCDQIAELLRTHDMPGGELTLEITEGVLLDAAPGVIETLSGLRALGCFLELDDFGTGFSSLSSLAQFNVDGLKIDRSFAAARGGKAGAIAQAVLAMASALGLRATAEGVEDDEQLAWLQERNCPEAQGYLFSRPVPAGEFTALLGAALPAAPVVGALR